MSLHCTVVVVLVDEAYHGFGWQGGVSLHTVLVDEAYHALRVTGVVCRCILRSWLTGRSMRFGWQGCVVALYGRGRLG